MLNVKLICNHLDCTENELAEKLEISTETLREYEKGTKKLPSELLIILMDMTGLGTIIIKPDGQKTHPIPSPNNTWETTPESKENFITYLKESIDKFKTEGNESLANELIKLHQCTKMLRKPKISFAGQSDAGKSTLINTLLNTDKLPSKWTPTTSISVHIKHIDERPQFIKDDVCIFRQVDNSEFDDFYLDDKDYYNQHLIESGDFSLLESYGTHQGKNEDKETASSALAFIDSPLLKNCDILDLPGFAVNDEDDLKHKFYTRENKADILIYLSRSNGFLQKGDLHYISECLKHLRPIELKDKNNIEPLENLFIVASQASTVNSGNATELNEILDRRCSALSSVLVDSTKNNDEILLQRSNITGYKYDNQILRKRFFTFEKNQERLCTDFIEAFNKTVEKLPKIIHENFYKNINILIEESKKIFASNIKDYETMIENRDESIKRLRELKDYEPKRKIEEEERKEKFVVGIEVAKAFASLDFSCAYLKMTKTGTIVEMMDNFGCKSKKESIEAFVTYYNNQINSRVEEIFRSFDEHCKVYLDNYLKKHILTLVSDDINFSFNVKDSFKEGLKGLVSLGVAGASATWLSTSTTAFIATYFGTSLGLTPFLTTLGVAGIGISAVIMALTSVIKAFTWKKDFAKALVKKYNENDFAAKTQKAIEKYCDDTRKSFLAACNKIEEDWNDQIAKYEQLANEEELTSLKEKLNNARVALAFYEHISSNSMINSFVKGK